MTEKLPTHNYKWMSEEELKEIDLLNYDLNGSEGMILISESITYKQTITVLRQIFVHFATFSSTFVAFLRPSCYMYNLNK